MGNVHSTDETVECRLYAAGDRGGATRSVHLHSAPRTIDVVEDEFGLTAVYRLTDEMSVEGALLATYLFDHLR